MRIVVLRSKRSENEKRTENEYQQEFDTRYADRVLGNLQGDPGFCAACGADCVLCRKPYRRTFGRDIAAVIDLPAVLPYMLENPADYVPKDIPPHDVLLIINIHEQVLIEILRECGSRGTKGVVVPMEAPDWLSGAARRQAFEICEENNIEIAFPKPFCSFGPPRGGVLAIFREYFHIGYPEVKLTVEDNTITKAQVNVSAACGATYYIARWLVGRNLNDNLETEVISKRFHSYPCTASMERDPELNNDTALHVAGQAHNSILSSIRKAVQEEPRMVLSPEKP